MKVYDYAICRVWVLGTTNMEDAKKKQTVKIYERIIRLKKAQFRNSLHLDD